MKATQSSCLSAKVEVCLQLEIASRDMKLLVEEIYRLQKHLISTHCKIIPKSFRVRVQSSDDVHEMPIRRLIRVLIRNSSPKKTQRERKKERKQQVCSNFASTASLYAQFHFRDILRKHPRIPKKTSSGIPYTVK